MTSSRRVPFIRWQYLRSILHITLVLNLKSGRDVSIIALTWLYSIFSLHRIVSITVLTLFVNDKARLSIERVLKFEIRFDHGGRILPPWFDVIIARL